MTRLLTLTYAGIAYLIFLASFVYAVGWLADVPWLPVTIDSRPGSSFSEALLNDAVLLSIFALQHSVMARPAFKRLWTRIVPPACERATYVLASSLCLFAICLGWQALPGTIWSLSGLAAGVAWGLCAVGWLVALASTYMLSHWELFGLKQALLFFRRETPEPAAFTERYLYRFVRHPLMLGFLIAFWSTPLMTVGHLAFALIVTAYVLVALQLEERDLRRDLGQTYVDYQERVPMLVPRLPAARALEKSNG